MLTLWDMLKPARARVAPGRPRSRRDPPPVAVVFSGEPGTPVVTPNGTAKATMRERYDRLTRDMLRIHGVRVRKWRSSMSGVAWQVLYRDGSVSRLIEAPRPKGPMSCAIFLHEIGHHAIGFDTHRLRCVEEYYAWRFAIETMERLGFNVTDRVRKRMDDSMRYAVDKARRRGLREVPGILLAYASGENAA